MTVSLAKPSLDYSFPRMDNGILTAYTRVNFIGFNGIQVSRRVRVGVEHVIDMDSAKNMMADIRGSNRDMDISGRFTMNM